MVGQRIHIFQKLHIQTLPVLSTQVLRRLGEYLGVLDMDVLQLVVYIGLTSAGECVLVGDPQNLPGQEQVL